MMFGDLIEFPIESERLNWEARQIVRDLYNEPHLFIRLKLTGTFFPQRALEPFVLVDKVRSRFVQISEDGLSAYAYFDQVPPETGRVEFGYGEEVLLRFPRRFSSQSVEFLDLNLIPKGTKNVKNFY